MDDALHLYEKYEWRPLFNGRDRIEPSGIWPQWKEPTNSQLGLPAPDWRFANNRLYMGTDTMDIGNSQKEGEYKICFETTVLPVRFILWGGRFFPIYCGETRLQTGIDITVTRSGSTANPGSEGEISVSVYKRDHNAHFVGSAKDISLPSEKMELRVIVFLEKGKKAYTGSVWFKGREIIDRFQLEMASASVTLFSGIYREISFRGDTIELQRDAEQVQHIIEQFPSLKPYVEEGF